MKKYYDMLISAIYSRNERKLKKAIEKGADVNKPDEDGLTPLMISILAESADVDIVKYLIDNGAQINIKEPKQGWTPLHFPARDERDDIVRILLDSGDEVDAKDIFGSTPLWRAVMNFRGDDSVIRMLLSHGANKNLENNYGISPMEIAQTSADKRKIEILQNGTK